MQALQQNPALGAIVLGVIAIAIFGTVVIFLFPKPKKERELVSWLDLFWAQFNLKDLPRFKLDRLGSCWVFQGRDAVGLIKVLLLDDENPGGRVFYRHAQAWLAKIKAIPNRMPVVIVTSREVPAQIEEFFRMQSEKLGQEIVIFSIQQSEDVDKVLSQIA